MSIKYCSKKKFSENRFYSKTFLTIMSRQKLSILKYCFSEILWERFLPKHSKTFLIIKSRVNTRNQFPEIVQ